MKNFSSFIDEANTFISVAQNKLLEIAKAKTEFSERHPKNIKYFETKIREFKDNIEAKLVFQQAINMENSLASKYLFVVETSLKEIAKSIGIFKNFLSLIDAPTSQNDVLIGFNKNLENINQYINNIEMNLNQYINDYSYESTSMEYYYNKIRPILFTNLFNRLKMHSPQCLESDIDKDILITSPIKHNGKFTILIKSFPRIMLTFNNEDNIFFLEVLYNLNKNLNDWQRTERFYQIDKIIPVSDCEIDIRELLHNNRNPTIIIKKLSLDVQRSLKHAYGWYVNFGDLKKGNIINIEDYKKVLYPKSFKK